MQLTERLDGYQRRHRWVGFPVAVIYKFFEDQGPYLAALITFYGFLSLFPLLLLLTSLLGFLLQDDSDLQQRILDSTLSQFPIIGDQLNDPQSLHGSGTAVVIGGLVALYGALGVRRGDSHRVRGSIPSDDGLQLTVSLRTLVIRLPRGSDVATMASTEAWYRCQRCRSVGNTLALLEGGARCGDPQRRHDLPAGWLTAALMSTRPTMASPMRHLRRC